LARKLKHWLEFGLFYSLFLLARPIPRSWLLAAGRGLGTFAWRVVGFRRQVIRDNLAHAFPDEDFAWREKVALGFYRNLGMTVMEFMASPWRKQDDVLNLVRLKGEEHMHAVLAMNKGALMLSGHFGNFEILPHRLTAEGVAFSGIVKSQSNPHVDRFQNDLRRKSGMGVIYTGGAFPAILSELKAGRFVGLLSDQDAGSKGYFTEFLGREASVFRGSALLAWKSGCPLITGHLYRQPDYTHVLEIDPPIMPDPDWDEETAIRILTENHVAHLEAAVRKAPEMYYWVHRRWKTRPPGEAKP